MRKTLKDGFSRRCTASFLKSAGGRNGLRMNRLIETVHDLPDVPADCVNRIDSRTLLRMLHEIDEDFRAPLVLYYMEDFSYKQIADCWRFRSGLCSRELRAQNCSFCVD